LGEEVISMKLEIVKLKEDVPEKRIKEIMFKALEKF